MFVGGFGTQVDWETDAGRGEDMEGKKITTHSRIPNK